LFLGTSDKKIEENLKGLAKVLTPLTLNSTKI
jgi:hypothetical protein